MSDGYPPVHATSDPDLSAAYDRMAPTYGTKRNPRYDQFRDEVLDWFIEHVQPIGRDVVDLGAGPGRESRYLQERGLAPLAVDFSSQMVAHCRANGVPAEMQDFTRLTLPRASFAGALMSFSLLHLPSSRAPGVLADIAQLLMPGGTLLILLFEGSGEGPRLQERSTIGTARWFTYYDAAGLRAILPPDVEVVHEWRLDISPRPTIGVAASRPRTAPRNAV